MENLIRAGARGRSPVEARRVVLRPGTGGPALCCLHPAAGFGGVFQELADLIGGDIPVWSMQSPGLDGAEPPPKDVAAYAELYVESLLHAQPEGVYMLAGWSFGGAIAFEMARTLSTRGKKVALLAMLDTIFPSLLSAEAAAAFTFDNTISVWASLVEEVAAIIGMRIPRPEIEADLRSHPVTTTGNEALLALNAIVGSLQRFGVFPTESESEPHALAVLRTTFGAADTYSPSGSSDVPITLLRANTEGMDYGWGKFAPVRVIQLEANHFTMMRQPQIKETAALLRRLTAEALSAS